MDNFRLYPNYLFGWDRYLEFGLDLVVYHYHLFRIIGLVFEIVSLPFLAA